MGNLCYTRYTSKGAYFFARFFALLRPREAYQFPITWRCRYESENHFGLHGMQAAQLQHNEKQEERSGQTGNEQVLPLLQKAYRS